MNSRLFSYKNLSLIAMMALIVSLFTYCNPNDKIDTSPALRLGFSTDTVLFDTVFTTIGSSTRTFKVYNRNNHRVNISDIHLSGADNSPFRINIDGQAGNSFTNIDIDAHDSIFVFVRVNINPNDLNAPFIRQDSLLFTLNGNKQKLDLVAWGQNAHYIIADSHSPGLPPYKIIAGRNQTVTWKADKPYVIYGYAVVDSTAKLIIEAGARVCFHNASGLWVYKNGTLKVNGTIDQKVIFEGDRTELYYDDIPGQWDRIWINESDQDNEINWAVIRNGFTGIQAETLGKTPGTGKLIIRNTVINNMTGYGLLTKKYRVEAGNLLIYDAGIQSLYLSGGGDYDFRHCTFSNFWNKSLRSTPAIRISNYFMYIDPAGNSIPIKGDLSKAYFGNCQIIGNKSEELLFENDPSAGTFNYLFDHSALQTQAVADAAHYNAFTRLSFQYYRLPIDTVIPAVRNIGSLDIISSSPTPISLINDLFGKDRTTDGKPDAGAIEFSATKRKKLF